MVDALIGISYPFFFYIQFFKNRTFCHSDGTDNVVCMIHRSLLMSETKTLLTTAAGAPVADNQNSLSTGPRGPLLMQDVWLMEKLAHFDREVIPE